MLHTLASQSESEYFELSTGQFAEFFQISKLPNATRLLRRILSAGETEYKGFRIRVEKRDNQYIAILSPIPQKTINFTENSSSRISPSDSSNDSFVPPFCDWLTIHQNYDYLLPPINSGCVVSLNSIPQSKNGCYEFQGSDIEFLTTRFISHKGSYETNLQLRIDRGKMTLSGNVGRFGKPDNLFGFSVLDCVKKANRVLDSLQLDLPHFSAGEYVSSSYRRSSLRSETDKNIGKFWTGAWISQLHLTKNLLFRDQDETKLFMDWACRQNPWGMSVHPHYGQGVNYGKNSAYVSPKLYLKGLEILENKKYKYIDDKYRNKLLNYINNRIVRFEINYKKFLSKNGVKYLGDIMNEEKQNILYIDFKNRLDRILRNDINFYENLEKLSRRRKEQFLAWTRGEDLSCYSRATYFRLLKEFKEKLNVDVSIPYSDDSILQVRTMDCQEITQIPEFYETSDLDSGLKLVA